MLEWLDANPLLYWTLAWSCFILLAVVGIGPVLASLGKEDTAQAYGRFWPRWLFFLALFVAFFAFRWPLFLVNEELNPDESQLIAGGISLQYDPIYWRSVDGTTHGPLDAYPLLAARLLGQPISYGSARLIGSLMMLTGVLLIYRTLARYYGDALARLGCLPAFCFFAFNTYWDFVHYSSEHAPAFLLTLGATLVGCELAEPAGRKVWSWRWMSGGLVLGAVPLAKLQGSPIAAALLFAAGLIDLCTGGMRFTGRLRRLGLLLAGALVVPAAFALITLAAGLGEDVWRSYVLQNFRYAGDQHHSHAYMLRHFWTYADVGTGFYAFTAGGAAFIVAALLRLPAFTAASLRLLVLGSIFFVASLVAVFTPGRMYAHYLLLLVIPATFLAGNLLGVCWQQADKHAATTRLQRGLLLLCFAGLLLWPQVQSRFVRPHPYLGKSAAQAALPPVAREILRHAKPGEPLGQWGWMCRYYVATGMPQATRSAHSIYEIQYTPQIDYYRARYLADLQRSRPSVFIDTVGPGNFVFEDRAGSGHEIFPALRDYISQHYRLVADIDHTRIYVRADQLGKP